jgi:hypothetical protein
VSINDRGALACNVSGQLPDEIPSCAVMGVGEHAHEHGGYLGLAQAEAEGLYLNLTKVRWKPCHVLVVFHLDDDFVFLGADGGALDEARWPRPIRHQQA